VPWADIRGLGNRLRHDYHTIDVAPWALLAQEGATGPAGNNGPTGPTGPSSTAGSNGTNGATGSLSPVTAYNPGATYSQGSVVFYLGSTYQSSANTNVSNVPTNGAFWTLIAQQGGTGTTGQTGALGPRDPTGPAGPAGPTGPTGPTGSGAAGLGTNTNTADQELVVARQEAMSATYT
jgi:hypothetical protein